MLALQHQQSAYQELVFRGLSYFSGRWRELPVKTRYHSLLVGPTGTGKSSLMAAVAATCDAHLVRISCPGWLPLSGREGGARETFPLILEALLRNERVLVFLDEIDKLGGGSGLGAGDSWVSYIKGEVFDLLDGVLRPHLRVPGEKDSDGTLEARRSIYQLRAKLTDRLMTGTFVVAAGTFQDFFDEGSKTRIGFGGCVETLPGINPEEIARRLPRELSNRFCADLVCLADLSRTDYTHMIDSVQGRLPSWIRKAFVLAAHERLEEAVRFRKACRFMEESLLAALRTVHFSEKVAGQVSSTN